MAELLKLTWADFDEFKPCYNPAERYGEFSGTMLDILRNPEIPDIDKLWAFTRGHLMTGDAAIDERILRLFACKCVRETPVGEGRTVWDLLTDERSRNAVDVAERYAIGQATQDELAAAWAASVAASVAAMAAWAARAAASAAARDAWAAMAAASVAARDADAARDAQVQFAIEIIEMEVQP
jgi:hypothetical protein